MNQRGKMLWKKREVQSISQYIDPVVSWVYAYIKIPVQINDSRWANISLTDIYRWATEALIIFMIDRISKRCGVSKELAKAMFIINSPTSTLTTSKGFLTFRIDMEKQVYNKVVKPILIRNT